MTAHERIRVGIMGVTGLLEGGATFSIHYRGGHSRGTNLLWEINGTEGDLQVTAHGGQAQTFEMTVRGGRGAQASLAVLPVPQQYWSPLDGPSTNVAHAYARFRPRLSRGNASLPHVRRRGYAPSHAGRDRDGRGNRSASNARLIRRGRG
jgi:predicted dehydrogenase